MRPLVTLFATLLLSLPAQAAPDDDAFDQLLSNIETVPTRAQLDTRWSDAELRLINAAKDGSRGLYGRVRATSMLALYPTRKVRESLQLLANDGAPELRREGIYTLARTFGTPGDPALVERVRLATGDASGAVREQAVRSLRWVDHPAAEALLRELVTKRGEAASIAKVTLQRRAKRLEQAVDVKPGSPRKVR